jgi:hypothetical protein
VESARPKGRQKRGGRRHRSALDPDLQAAPAGDADDWIDLADALTRFEAVDPAAAALAKLRVFGGLTVAQAGEVLGIPRASAFRVWTYSQAWLTAALADGPPAQPPKPS